jgi:FlaA1/EpsC-like NDP-sugar epimerase
MPQWGLYSKILYAVVPLWLAIFWYASRLYDAPWISSADRFLRIAKGCLLSTVATMTATYIYSRLEYSRMMLALVLPISVALVCLSQALVLWIDDWVSRCEAARPVLVVGGGSVADLVKERIRQRHPGAAIHEIPELPEPGRLKDLLMEEPFGELILCKSSLPHGEILEAAELCDAHGAIFKMLPNLLELRLGEVQSSTSP